MKELKVNLCLSQDQIDIFRSCVCQTLAMSAQIELALINDNTGDFN